MEPHPSRSIINVPVAPLRDVTPDSTIPTVPIPLGLSAAACRTNEHRALATWTLLARVVDKQQTGQLRRRDAVRALQALGLRRSAANDAVRDLCASRYADLRYEQKRKEPFVVFRSIANVHASYGITDRRHDVKIPLDRLIGSRQLKRLFAAVSTAIFTGPASRATRVSVIGVSPSTQRRGERDYRATVTPTYIEHDRATTAELADLPAIDRGRVFVSGDKLLERGANQIQSPFNVVRRSRRRPSPSQATGESPVTRPQRQRFDSEQDLKRHTDRHGVRPQPGFAYANPEDERRFVRSAAGTTHRFGGPVRIYRVADQPTLMRRLSAK